MSLHEELVTQAALSSKRIPEASRKIMIADLEQLAAAGLVKKGPQRGNKLPDFSLVNQVGEAVSLADLRSQGPVILNFYRGGWCPYCNLELRAWQSMLPEVTKYGATLIAITPETPDNSLTTREKNELAFPVLTDHDNHYGRRIGLVFSLSQELREVYSGMGIDLVKSNQNGNWELPFPATITIDSDGTVISSYVAADYKQRAEPKEVLDELKRHLENNSWN